MGFIYKIPPRFAWLVCFDRLSNRLRVKTENYSFPRAMLWEGPFRQWNFLFARFFCFHRFLAIFFLHLELFCFAAALFFCVYLNHAGIS